MLAVITLWLTIEAPWIRMIVSCHLFFFFFSDSSSNLMLLEPITSTTLGSVRISYGWPRMKFWSIFRSKLNSLRSWSSADSTHMVLFYATSNQWDEFWKFSRDVRAEKENIRPAVFIVSIRWGTVIQPEFSTWIFTSATNPIFLYLWAALARKKLLILMKFCALEIASLYLVKSHHRWKNNNNNNNF